MVNYSASVLDDTFGALSHPIRRGILDHLARGAASVMELAAPFDVSLPAVSRHLRVLESAGLIQRTKVGRVIYCRLEAEPLGEAARWLAFYQQFWDQRLDNLGDFLDEGAPDSGGE